MTGSKQTLSVYLGQHQVAEIVLSADQLHWRYNDTWQKTGYAVSPHLPLHSDTPTLNVQRFLRNLLPEGKPLDVLVDTFHFSKSNTFALMRALGLDTSGSLIILPGKQAPPSSCTFR